MRDPRKDPPHARRAGIIARLLGNRSRQQPTVVGNVDGIHGSRLCGWALDIRTPRRRLVVTLEGLPDGPAAVVADRYRGDLQYAGVGDGYSGFAVRVAGPLPWLRVLAGSPPVELPGGSGSPAPDPQRLLRSGSFALYLDNADARSGLRGWALDTARPGERQTLLVRDGTGHILAAQRATHHHADLENDGRDSFHGFAFLPIAEGFVGPLRIEDAGQGHVFALPG